MVAIAAPAFAAEADFSTSTASHEPQQAIAGDVVRFVVTVANTGGDSSYARITSTLSNGFFIRAAGDCAAAPLDRDHRTFIWHEGAFPAGSIKQCRIDLLTRRQAAGTIAPLVTEIRTMPSGYRRLESAPELAAPPDPALIRLGPFGIALGGLVVVGFFGFSIVGATIVVRISRRRNRKMALGAWLAIIMGVGFLLFFLDLARKDFRSYREYREASCFVFDSNIRAFQGAGRSDRSNTYATEFAVRYVALGAEIHSSGYPPPSAINLGWIGDSQRMLERFSVGSVHPCWFDPQDVKTVLLERGPGAAYVFGLLPLMMLASGLWMLITEARPNDRRKAKSKQPIP